ncbi:uncharacterized protein LOC136041442 isoform X2 [Artemia franciscana]
MIVNISTSPVNTMDITIGTTADEPQYAIAATYRPNPYDRQEYYRTYDPMTGVRIATTLTGFFAFTVFYILCKKFCYFLGNQGRCGRRRMPLPSRRTSQATSMADVEDPLVPSMIAQEDIVWWQPEEVFRSSEKRCQHDCIWKDIPQEGFPWEEKSYWKSNGFKGSLSSPFYQNHSFESCGSSSCQCRHATKSLPGSALRIISSLEQSQVSLNYSENTCYSNDMCSNCSVCQNEKRKLTESVTSVTETKKRIMPMRSVSFRESDLPSREEQNSFKIRKPPARAVSFREEDCDIITPLPVANKPSVKKLSRSITTIDAPLPAREVVRAKSILRASSVSESNYAPQKLNKQGRPPIPRYCLLCRSSSKQKLHQCFRSISLSESENPPSYLLRPLLRNSIMSSNNSVTNSHKSTPRGSVTHINKSSAALRGQMSLDLSTNTNDSVMPTWRTESVETNKTASHIDICVTQPTPSVSPCASVRTLSDSLENTFIKVIPASPMNSPSIGRASDRRKMFAHSRAKGTTVDWTEEEYQSSFPEPEQSQKPMMDYLTVPSHTMRHQIEEPMRPCSDCGLPKQKDSTRLSRERLDVNETSFTEFPIRVPPIRSPSRTLSRSFTVTEDVEARRTSFSRTRNATFDGAYKITDDSAQT